MTDLALIQYVWQKLNIVFLLIHQLMGAPTGHEVPIKEVRLSAGAEFIVVVCGEIMTMPGLPKSSSSGSNWLR